MKKIFGIMVCLAHLLNSTIFAFSLSPENFSLLGVGQARWTQGNEAAPYHAANVTDIFGTYLTPSKNFQVDARITFENPSVSHEYLEKQRAYARITVTYQKEFDNHDKWILKSGNLGEVTIGRGLTLKDQESMGFMLGWNTPILSTSLTYIGRGYSQYGDYAIVDVHPTHPESVNLGAYYFLMIPETKTQYVSRIVSGYADVPCNAPS